MQHHSRVSIRERPPKSYPAEVMANTVPNTENAIQAKMIVMLNLEQFLTHCTQYKRQIRISTDLLSTTECVQHFHVR